MEEIILASGSPRRKQLLEQIGVPIRVVVSGVEESVTETEPDKIVEELSFQKADSVAQEIPDGIVLGADTIVWAEGHALGKPADREDGARMIGMLQGNEHSVFTGVTLIRREGGETKAKRSFARETVVHVHEMTEAEIDAYLNTGDPFDKAGGYGIQGPFAAYVDGIEGDYTNVVGLPVSAVWQELKKLMQE